MNGQLALIPGGKSRQREPRPPHHPQPTWTTYTGVRPVKCVDCLNDIADRCRDVAKLGRRRYRDAPNRIDVIVCYEHANARGDTMSRPRRRAAG